MANIGIARASYYADTSIHRLNRDLEVSVARVASARKNVTASDVASLKSMDYSFRLDYAATKAAVKSMSVTQAYLSTAISSLDSSSEILSKIHELAVMGANGSNSADEQLAINAEAEALADEFHEAMQVSNFKGKVVLDKDGFNSQMSLGRSAAKTSNFGLGEIDYDFFYDYKNPETSILNAGIEYEITRELTADQKASILSRTEGLTEEQLVVGFRFKTNVVADDNVGNGSVSVIDGRSVGGAPNDTLEYNRGDGVVRFDPTAVVTSDDEFAGGSVVIEISENLEDADSLSIRSVGPISIDNATGIVTYNDPDDGLIEIGIVREAQNGQNGKVLKVELFGDSTKPDPGGIENGDFEKLLRNQDAPPTPVTTYGVWKTNTVQTYSIASEGAGYVTAGDANMTPDPRDSDTYNISFQGGTGTGFRANVIVAGGKITGIEVIDGGEGYTAGDTLRIAGNHFSAGAGFQLNIDTVSTRVVRETVAGTPQIIPVVEFWNNPPNDPGEADARYSWGEVYTDGQVKKELVSEDETVNPGVAGASLTDKLHLAAGSYDNVNIGGNPITWQTGGGVNKYSIGGAAFDGQYVRGDNVKLFNQARLNNNYTAVKELHTTGPGTYNEVEWGVDWIDDATGNENYRTNAAVWDGSYQLGDEKLEKLDNYQAGAVTIYEAHVAAGTYDEAAWGVTWQNGGGENNYMTNAGAWDGSYAVGDKKLVKLANNEAGATTVYVRNTNASKAAEGPRYSWGEEIQVGGRRKVEANPGDAGAYSANYIHEANGTYSQAEWGVTWTAANGAYKFKSAANTFFTGDFLQNTNVLEKSTDGTGVAIYEAHTEAGTYAWGAAYQAGDIKVTQRETGRSVVNEVEVINYAYDQVVAFRVKDKVRFIKDDIAFYTKDKVAFYTKENEAFYAANDRVWVREATDGSTITRYTGEVETNRNSNLVTSYTPNSTALIQNWYYSELDDDGTPRVKFGAGDQAGSFKIKDSDNGALISSSLVLNDDANRFVDNSKEITVPTPSWNTMKTYNNGSGSPAYAPYEKADGTFRTSDPTKEDQDHGGLEVTSSDSSIGLVNGRTGNAVELDTGFVKFDNDDGFGIYHGPAIVSDEFDAYDGQILRLEYTAQGQADDYHVTGYIYEVDGNGNAVLENGKPKFTIALMETGTSVTNGRASINVDTDGRYRFVFIVGTHDLTGGQEAGANMTIDNIVVEWPATIDNEVMEAILRSVHYENSSDTATSSKTLKATISSKSGNIQINDKAIIDMGGFNVTSAGDGGPYMEVPLENLVTTPKEGVTSGSANALTAKIEKLQGQITASRVQAASQYSAIESAMDSATDLRSQFALASGTLSDLNFSRETAYLAKKQVQQDMATAMLAQANQEQSNLIMLIAE